MGADAPDPVVGGVAGAHDDLRPPPLGRGRYPAGRRQPATSCVHLTQTAIRETCPNYNHIRKAYGLKSDSIGIDVIKRSFRCLKI
ncbi:hypothetical protein TNCT_349181 [Trichonephila clavata]|uniref:Uncharacterized protein n=1 Tax=Trichonephila clavata TaxID=2740835 RepID=A0A8X6HZW4_TRICU|nr:hypothetical protein TNCT_349181 [Trichonephila clavata]